MWRSTINPTEATTRWRFTDDGRMLVLDERGFWITVNINKSVPSWQRHNARA